MLGDKDRIFLNLYGAQDWRLEAAKKRGAWNATKDMIDCGRDWIIQQVKDSGLRGRGGAGRVRRGTRPRSAGTGPASGA